MNGKYIKLFLQLSVLLIKSSIYHCQQIPREKCRLEQMAEVVITDHIRSMGEGNVFTGVCLFTGESAFGEGVCLEGCLHEEGSAYRGICKEGGKGLHGMGTPCRDMVNRRSVRILLECIIVFR